MKVCNCPSNSFVFPTMSSDPVREATDELAVDRFEVVGGAAVPTDSA